MVDAPETLEARLRKGRLAYRTASGAVYAGPTAIETEAADRIAQLERDLAEARAETLRAKTIISKACNHLPNGAFCSPEASLDFMERVPDEVLIVTSGLVNKITAAEAESDRLAAVLREIANGCEGRVDRDSLPCRIARASLQNGEKGE